MAEFLDRALYRKIKGMNHEALESLIQEFYNILNIFQPSKILIGGGISKEGDYLLNPLREYVYAGDYNKHREKTKIEAATLFNDAGIIGAALSGCRL